MNLTTKHRVVAAISAVVLVSTLLWWPEMLAFGMNGYASARERLQRIPFDSAAWQDAKQVDTDNPVRIRMVDDLIHSGRLDHRTRAEVEGLLGKSTRTNYFKQFDLVYWLGPERSFISIDSESLVISLDGNGIVQKYQVVHD